MINIFGEEYTEIPKSSKPTDKRKRAWEDAFQRWSNKEALSGSTPMGCCGYGAICDWCANNHYGRPCVRALNEMAREKHMEIDYGKRNFEEWFMGIIPAEVSE